MPCRRHSTWRWPNVLKIIFSSVLELRLGYNKHKDVNTLTLIGYTKLETEMKNATFAAANIDRQGTFIDKVALIDSPCCRFALQQHISMKQHRSTKQRPCFILKTPQLFLTVDGQRRKCLETLTWTTFLIGRTEDVSIFHKKTRLCVSVSFNYPVLLRHELQITGVADLVVAVKSCSAVKFCILLCYTAAFMRKRKDNVIVQRTVTVPVVSGAISPTLTGTTLSMELWF